MQQNLHLFSWSWLPYLRRTTVLLQQVKQKYIFGVSCYCCHFPVGSHFSVGCTDLFWMSFSCLLSPYFNVCCSLFRQTNDVEAKLTFETLCKTLVVVARACPALLAEEMLQKLCDCSRERHTWNAAHVTAFIGLHSALEQKELQG